jgi:S-adenosylmethionine:tRNA ribosyltransferase-isomerase
MTQLSQFDYCLPKELIAQKPIRPRDHSRLMVLDRRTGKISHHFFYQIGQFLRAGDVLVLNNSKVVPAKLLAKKETGGKAEILLLKKIKSNIYEAIVKSKIKDRGARLQITSLSRRKINLIAKPIKNLGEGRWLLSFNLSGQSLEEAIDRYGLAPTPPYIKRISNLEEYQTIYAKYKGSVAAPTAGFHFTKRLIKQLMAKGVRFEFLTLHVGLGTFQPVRVEKIEEHRMHPELAILKKDVAERINRAKKDGRRIIAVGTTSVRALESFFNQKLKKLIAGEKMVDLFIYPGYQFRVVDGLITNFHLPKSTLLMLVSAFAGRDFIFKAYQWAIQKKYRFYSFGDAMLII